VSIVSASGGRKPQLTFGGLLYRPPFTVERKMWCAIAKLQYTLISQKSSLLFITARRSYASAVLGVVILSVRLSVRPSVCYTLRLIQRTYRWYFIPYERAILLVFCYPTVVDGRRPLPPKISDRSDPPPFKNRSRRQISACTMSTVRASEESSIMTNRKSYAGFPTGYRWSAYVTSKSPKGWPKKRTSPFLE